MLNNNGKRPSENSDNEETIKKRANCDNMRKITQCCAQISTYLNKLQYTIELQETIDRNIKKFYMESITQLNGRIKEYIILNEEYIKKNIDINHDNKFELTFAIQQSALLNIVTFQFFITLNIKSKNTTLCLHGCESLNTGINGNNPTEYIENSKKAMDETFDYIETTFVNTINESTYESRQNVGNIEIKFNKYHALNELQSLKPYIVQNIQTLDENNALQPFA